MKKNPNYSFLLGLEKTVLRLIVVVGPMLLELAPETWMNLTIGGIITFGINFAKNYYAEEEQYPFSQG